MTTERLIVNINGIKTTVEKATTISYETLCKLAVQPARFNPTITYTLDPIRTGRLWPGESAPLEQGAVYSVWITGSTTDKK